MSQVYNDEKKSVTRGNASHDAIGMDETEMMTREEVAVVQRWGEGCGDGGIFVGWIGIREGSAALERATG